MNTNRASALSVLMAFLMVIAGCTDKSAEPEPIPSRFFGSLTLVVLTETDSLPHGVPDIPVILGIAHQVDPGPFTYDTVFTNEYGVAFFKQLVECGTYDNAGKLRINIVGIETRTVYFKNGEEIDIIVKTP